MAHANAALTPRHRLRLARLIVEDGWSPSRAAEFLQRLLAYGIEVGPARPRRRTGRDGRPDLGSTDPARQDLTPGRASDRAPVLEAATRTSAHRGQARHAGLDGPRRTDPLNRLFHIDRVTGEPARRYERERPGELIMSTSRSSAISPTAAGGATWAADKATRTA